MVAVALTGEASMARGDAYYIMLARLSYPPRTDRVREMVQNNGVMVYEGNFEALVRFAGLNQFQAALEVLHANRGREAGRIRQTARRIVHRLHETTWPNNLVTPRDYPHYIMVCLSGFVRAHGTAERVMDFTRENVPTLVDSGQLRSIFVPLQPNSPTTHAFVWFLHHAAAVQAVQVLDGMYWQGTRISAG